MEILTSVFCSWTYDAFVRDVIKTEKWFTDPRDTNKCPVSESLLVICITQVLTLSNILLKYHVLRKCVIIYKNITIILLSIHITKRQYGIQYFRAQCDVQWIILKSQSLSTSDYKNISNSSCSYYVQFDEPMYPINWAHVSFKCRKYAVV